MNKLILLSFIILLFILLNIFTKYENLTVGPTFNLNKKPKIIYKEVYKKIKDEKCEEEYNILNKNNEKLKSLNETIIDENKYYKTQIDTLKSYNQNNDKINNLKDTMKSFIKSNKKKK